MRILIVYDVEGWAQYRHACGLRKYSPDDFDVEICSVSDYRQMRSAKLSGFTAVYCLSLYACKPTRGVNRLVGLVAADAWMFERYNPTDWRTRGVTTGRNSQAAEQLVPSLDGVVCRNRRLADWTRNLNQATAHIPAGVDTEVFCPDDNFRRMPDKFRVGWCANPGGSTTCKGLKEIAVPLRQATQHKWRWDIKTHDYKTADNVKQMVEWYRSLDAFVCTSSVDGTPNPPFEAAACGVPVVSTEVGQVADWKNLHELGLVVPTYRNITEAKERCVGIEGRIGGLELKNDLRQAVSQALVDSIRETYSYAKLAPITLRYVATGEGP